MSEEKFKEPQLTDFIDEVEEVKIDLKDHRADDDFEKMLAELNGRKAAPEKKQPKVSHNKPQETAAKESDKTDTHADAHDGGGKKKEDTEQKAQPEKKQAVEAMSAAIALPGAVPAIPPERESRIKNDTAKKQKKSSVLTDEEKLELKRKAEAARRAEAERENKEREQKLIESISNIWQSPDFSAGGRVKMNIKTEQRKEIHVTIPSGHEERVKARKEAQMTELAKADVKRRNVEEEQRIAAAAAAIDKLEDPEIPPELLGRKKASGVNTAATATAAQKAPAKIRKEKKSQTPEADTRIMPAVKPAADADGEKSGGKSPVSAENAKAEAAKPQDKERKNNTRAAKAELAGRKFHIANVIVCCAIFFSVGVFLIVCKRESGFIQSENRMLAEKPQLTLQTLMDGSYFEDITKWYTDTIPCREDLKPFSSSFEKLFGVSFNNVKIKGDITPVKKETLAPQASVTTTTVPLNTDFANSSDKKTSAKTTAKKEKKTSEKLADVPDNLDDGAWIGNVVVTGTGENVRALSAFYGQFDMGAKYAETINRYKEDLGSSVNVYTLNMPSAAAYYLPKNLADEFTSQQDCITNIGNNLAGIINVDTYAALEAHKDEYIYSRTDHHWQPLGAYYAAKAFSVLGDFDFPDISEYEECRIEDFVGTMYAYSNYDEELADNPDTFIYYKPDNDYSVTDYDSSFENGYESSLFFDYASGVNCYSAILGTDDQITEITTDAYSNRTLVVIKDSFGNALIPFLTHGFDKIYVVDFRYFDINAIDFINEVGATDLLFAVSIGSAHTESHINAIGNLRIQTNNPVNEEELPQVVLPQDVMPGDDDGQE